MAAASRGAAEPPAPARRAPGAAAAAAHAAGFAQRHRFAAVGCAACFGSLSALFVTAMLLMPFPPAAMGWTALPRGGAGLTPQEAGQLAAMVAAFSAALLAAQRWALRPLFGPGPKATEAVFFTSSLLVRAVFLSVLFRHHFGPGRHDTAALGDLGHRLPTAALFFAAYATDLAQMIWRRAEFAPAYVKMVVPHHWASLAFFGVWAAALAPRGAAGAPNWNTNLVYLTCCVPIHMFKLATTFYRPWWAPFAVLPVLLLHWALLLGSQLYLFATCTCSAYGCWYTGTVWMFVGGWGMVVYTLHDRFNSIILGCSRALGNPITLYDCPRLLRGVDTPPRAPKAPPARARGAPATPAASPSGSPRAARCSGGGGGSEGEPVTVELVFRAAAPRRGASKGVKPAAAAVAGPAAAAVAALAAAIAGAVGKAARSKPACVVGLEEEIDSAAAKGAAAAAERTAEIDGAAALRQRPRSARFATA
ncbi:MAG: hypothetical protein J3K34DRAFT_522179 [Monoraphidium minutum]|nr:MAG: hypothetical protein J3K34DRAFT_522179 [Monoraphidium minutum]